MVEDPSFIVKKTNCWYFKKIGICAVRSLIFLCNRPVFADMFRQSDHFRLAIQPFASLSPFVLSFFSQDIARILNSFALYNYSNSTLTWIFRTWGENRHAWSSRGALESFHLCVQGQWRRCQDKSRGKWFSSETWIISGEHCHWHDGRISVTWI